MAKLLKIKTVAEALDVHPKTVLRMIRAGELPAVQLRPGMYRVEPAELEAYIERQRVCGEPEPELIVAPAQKTKKRRSGRITLAEVGLA